MPFLEFMVSLRFKYVSSHCLVSVLLIVIVIIRYSAGLRAGDRGSRVRFPAGAGNFSLHYRVQNGSGAHPATYPMGTRGSFPGDKAAGA
jgi:hypothetical protein